MTCLHFGCNADSVPLRRVGRQQLLFELSLVAVLLAELSADTLQLVVGHILLYNFLHCNQGWNPSLGYTTAVRCHQLLGDC